MSAIKLCMTDMTAMQEEDMSLRMTDMTAIKNIVSSSLEVGFGNSINIWPTLGRAPISLTHFLL